MSNRTDSTPDDRVAAALDALAVGQAVVVADHHDRENEGDLIFAAEFANPELVAFTVRHTSGFLCVSLPGDTCDRLGLVPMVQTNQDRYRTAYQVTVDLRGTGTGISARSRAATVAALASEHSVSADFTRPGHVVPLRARPGGVLERPGHTEAAVDLTRLAGLTPAAALCEIVSEDRLGAMAHGEELIRFADRHGLVHLSVEDVVGYRLRHESQVARMAEAALPTSFGTFRAVGYREFLTGSEHLALVAGTVDGSTPVHVHVECLCGDVFNATSCICRATLDAAMRDFGAAGRGVVVYLRPPGTLRAGGSSGHRSGARRDVGTVAGSILADLGVDELSEARDARIQSGTMGRPLGAAARSGSPVRASRTLAPSSVGLSGVDGLRASRPMDGRSA